MPHPAPKPGILDIAPYVGGKSSAKPGVRVVKLSSNETPLGPSPAAVEAYAACAQSLHRYPDGHATKLRDTIADIYGLVPERIVCGAGSDELIGLLMHAYAGPGDEVLYSRHGFLMYKIYAQSFGATPVTASEKDLRTDVDAMLAAVTPRTKIVFLANPNNPTGSHITGDELKRLHAGLPPHVLLAVDAAYAEYAESEKKPSPLGRGLGEGLSAQAASETLPEPRIPHPNPLPKGEGISNYDSGQFLAETTENTVMLRTFSKIYGLSSLRLGWAYGAPHIIDVINRIRGPFNVSAPALAAGAAAVRDTVFIEATRRFNKQWLGWLAAEIGRLGLKVYPSIANFLLVEFPQGAHTAARASTFLMERGLIVRDVIAYGLPDALRISVGLEEDNRAVVAALAEFLSIPSPLGES